MCYRNSNTKTKKENEERFDSTFKIEYDPYYHFAGYESRNLYIIKQDEYDDIVGAYWGIMDEFTTIKERDKLPNKFKPTNKRAETLFKTERWRKKALEQRCIILSDGFFEPHSPGGNYKNIPHYIRYKDHDLFAFAGLYSELEDGNNTATIITREANPFFERIHNVLKEGTFRMPLVLNESDEVDWLSSDLNEGDVEELLHSFTKKEFEAYPVSRTYSNTPEVFNKVDYPELNTLGLFD